MGQGVLSKLSIASSTAPQSVKRMMFKLLDVDTVAAAGADETNATLLSAGRNVVTAADGTVGVILPVAVEGMAIEVINTESAQDLKVYPNISAQINALTATTGAFTVVGGASRTFFCDAPLHWYVGAGNLTGTATTSSTAELNYNDITTLGTLQASKVWTSDASLDTVMPTGGKLTVQSGGDITLESGSTLDVAGTFEIANVAMTATAAELNAAAGVTLGTSAASKNLTTDAAESLVWATTDNTASETVTLSIQDTRTGAGATGWTMKGELVSNVALGAYANGLYGLMTFGATGSVTGLAAGVVGEVELSAGTTGGTYAALEAELVANAEVSTGTDTGFIYGNIAGSNATGKTTINTNAHLLVLGTGVVDTASGLWDAIGAQAVTASGRLRIKIGATLYYIPVCASAALTS